MKDISIFVWNIVIIVIDIILFVRLLNHDFAIYDSFYEEVYRCIRTFVLSLVCFFTTVIRAFLYTGYIIVSANIENCSGWKLWNGITSWMPFAGTISVFIWSVCWVFSLFKQDSYKHYDKTYCSIKTIKLISTLSGIDYNNYYFYYEPNRKGKIFLCFNPFVYVFMCLMAYRNDKVSDKRYRKERNTKKEQKLYEALISDLEEIKKENEVEASKCFDKAKETLKNIK